MESKRKEAQQLLVSCFLSCLLQLVTSSSPIVFSSFFVESIAFFSLFFWLLQVLLLGLLHFLLAIGVLCFFIVLLLVFLFLVIGLFFLEVLRWFVVFFATSVNSSCWRWISCFMGTNATCVFFVAHGLPRLILGSWCCSFVLQVLCVVNVIQALPMLLVCGASIDYVCCRCYLSTSNIILCATSAINVTLALPMIFKEFKFYWWCSHAFNDA